MFSVCPHQWMLELKNTMRVAESKEFWKKEGQTKISGPMAFRFRPKLKFYITLGTASESSDWAYVMITTDGQYDEDDVDLFMWTERNDEFLFEFESKRDRHFVNEIPFKFNEPLNFRHDCKSFDFICRIVYKKCPFCEDEQKKSDQHKSHMEALKENNQFTLCIMDKKVTHVSNHINEHKMLVVQVAELKSNFEQTNSKVQKVQDNLDQKTESFLAQVADLKGKTKEPEARIREVENQFKKQTGDLRAEVDDQFQKINAMNEELQVSNEKNKHFDEALEKLIEHVGELNNQVVELIEKKNKTTSAWSKLSTVRGLFQRSER
ncbi:hypothetical protein M3Y94_00642600 [Aphelenchoides besseyi]|nr:hypothetical protein M3Y94_00642600 [Aphelenchoides besseyi]KAI6231039.1 hypothetical protein M3Y95_00339400 [Aphelenchoides besseyi]